MIEGVIRIGTNEWEVPVGFVPNMRVPGRFYLSESLGSILEPGAVQQLANVATLPGIIGHSLAMPDIHWGYGFPIGGVAAFSLEEGVISPGGVGFDINCGVRLFTTPLEAKDITGRRDLVDALFSAVPTGVGAKSPLKVSPKTLDEMMTKGARWAVESGYGLPRDLERCEDRGCMKQADSSQVSAKAKQRGVPQGGTLGSGNHFLELQVVREIYDPDAARAFGISAGQVCCMIHCGSRGLGHQVCTDHLKTLEQATKRYHIALPDRQLACAPILSPEGKAYFGAMAASANYAWANRQMIMHTARNVISRLCGIDYNDMPLVYDVAHNVAKREEHQYGGKRSEVCVHRKGATRAFGPGSPDLPPDLGRTGQPVIIPGSMGTSSFVLHGTHAAMEKTFGSTCHGAGRIMSRTQAKKKLSGKEIAAGLLKEGIIVRAPNENAIADEAPDVYKPSDEVVNVVHEVGISKLVARLVPVGVIKG
ncbi:MULTISPECIES: RtcB family protein [unclassified Methanoregula]|uniref:RtcB family protein n=1 Tax=unclassified Methanoregula TaxID=2649730 RepID=UPI0009D0CAA0|nr:MULTISPECIES: RtcB family protein [unclassified Methanoregula]OPX65153.1 MAG: tRNA-splicing ligase RtcB [Methanoregula sp. PtaB.Bin085]OPY32065.1 MAG: tRNA-splicing ligase RtcB [Methanoregula sp. PtaU1.Bin006]